jgi:hypothetical protein
MIRGALLTGALCLPPLVSASPWTYDDPVTVAGDSERPHFHHLDGAGRTHVAASNVEVALVWEDDRSGAPQVYVAVKPHSAASFSRTEQLSDGAEAYEPAITTIGEGRWMAAWEQDGAVVARVIDGEGLGPVLMLGEKGSRQVALAGDDSGRIAALWARQQQGGQLVEAAELRVEQGKVISAAPALPVSPITDHPNQGYPAAAWTADGRLLIAWEDRRAGHTRLFHSWRDRGQSFASARQLNQHFAPSGNNGQPVGLGTGVMRVSLAVDDSGTARAVWLDKRDAKSGYAVWGATSDDGGRNFGPNQRVQDALGDAVAQWHASVAGGKPGFVATWDDTREDWANPNETGDVLVSWNSGSGWSDDLLVPGASGEGYQGSPAVTIDPAGDLHLVWIERADLSSPTRLRYLRGTLDAD